MKKKALLLMASALLMLAMVPAAFAADNERPLPDENMIVSAESDISLLGEKPYPGAGTVEDPYRVEINSAQDFQQLTTYCKTYDGSVYDVTINQSIDLSDGEEKPQEWKGYLPYFYGTIHGNTANDVEEVISGIPENCYLIYTWIGGSIEDLTIELDGQAGTLVYMQSALKDASGVVSYKATAMKNLTVQSSAPVQLKDNSQANYAPFIFSSGPRFLMDNCVNYADISGNTYGSVFYGYYPLAGSGVPEDGYVKIQNCQNHGNITYRYGGLVFGNPTGLLNKKVSVSNVTNCGFLRGTETIHFFSSDVGQNDWISMYKTEGNLFSDMEKNISNAACTDTGCPKHGDETHKMGEKYVGDVLTGLDISVNDNKQFVITQPTEISKVDHYVVTGYRYVTVYDKNGQKNGTGRINITVNVPKSAAEKIDVAGIGDYLITDGTKPDGTKIQDIDKRQEFALYLTSAGNYVYWFNNTKMFPSGNFYYLNADKTPGSYPLEVYVSAYNKDGQLLDTATLKR